MNTDPTLNTSGATTGGTDQDAPMTCKLAKKQTTSELITESVREFVTISTGVAVLAMVLAFFGLEKLYIYYAIGLYCSSLATYYKYKVWVDPSFKPKNCNCVDTNSYSQSAMKGILTVLDHKKGSMLFNIPNSVFGILFYSFLILVHLFGMNQMFLIYYMIRLGSLVSCVGGVFLWYTMVYEVRSICILCMTIHSVNFLTFVRLFF